MKAAQISKYGDPSVVHVHEIEIPAVGEGQVSVEVHAASINPFDSKIRTGAMAEMIPLHLPVTLGADIAGIVAKVGDNVTNVTVGDKVYGQANAVAGNSGAFAEFATTKSSELAKMPKSLDFSQAASLSLVGVSAVQALLHHINLQPGQKIFVHGGAGGIGSIAIQIAKHIGAYVATSATGDGIAFVKELGADEVIDYKTDDFSTILHDYDAVYDNVGGDDFAKSFAVLKKGGIAVTMAAEVDDEKAKKYDIVAIHQMTRVTTQVLDQLTQLIEAGAISPQIAMTFPLSEVKEAFEAKETGTVSGKIVISIR